MLEIDRLNCARVSGRRGQILRPSKNRRWLFEFKIEWFACTHNLSSVSSWLTLKYCLTEPNSEETEVAQEGCTAQVNKARSCKLGCLSNKVQYCLLCIIPSRFKCMLLFFLWYFLCFIYQEFGSIMSKHHAKNRRGRNSLQYVAFTYFCYTLLIV